MAKKIKTKKTGAKLPRSIRRMFPEVKECVDAAQPVEISVASQDCKSAKRLDPTNCALARAAKREVKADGAIIGMSTSYLIQGTKAIRFQTPQSVQREIVSFDRHDDFEPGEYYLTPKSPATRLGVDKHTRKKDRGGKYKRKYHKNVRVRVFPKGAEREA